MNESLLIAALTAAAAAAVATLLMIRPTIQLAHRIEALDQPGGRKAHQGEIPRLGGVAVGLGIVVGIGVTELAGWALSLTGKTPLERFEPLELVVFGLAWVLVFLIGLWDDIRGLQVAWKVMVEFGAAAMVVFALDWKLELLRLPWGTVDVGPIGALLAILWVIGITNAINLLDGLDGLAGGIACIIATSLMLIDLIGRRSGMALIAAVVAGACLGFLRHNWSPAKIFLGDAGSLSLGFMLAVMTLRFSVKSTTAAAVLVPILALGLPAIDTLWVMVVRYLDSPDRSLLRRLARMFKGDRNHLHYVLLALAPKRSRIVVWLYAFVAASCVMAIVVSVGGRAEFGIGLVAVEVLAIAAIRWMGARAQAREQVMAARRELREQLAHALSPESELDGLQPPVTTEAAKSK
jgi:UDP-GlcNAc:undecaprenyl-phosphate GlcNAc-1-phosphate transferase